MTVNPFKLHTKRDDWPWQLRDALPDDGRWFVTDYVGPQAYGSDDIMHESNCEAIMARLRAADKAGEGTATGHPNYGFAPAEATWFEYAGRIAYRTPVAMTRDHWKEARARGHFVDLDYDRWGAFGAMSENDATGGLEVERAECECPILDELLAINRDLRDYPVLDDNDFSFRETEAEVENVKSSAPVGCPPLTDKQAYKVRWFLDQSSWPADDPNDEGCPAAYQIAFNGDDYSGDLDEAVAYALKALKIYPHPVRRRRPR